MSLPSRAISVIGSLNIDLVTVTPRVPNGGETLTASSFSTGFGGKGANQAVACARLLRSSQGASAENDIHVRMIGAVGDDDFGSGFRKHLEEEGIDIEAIKIKSGQSTGTAVILVEKDTGENRILITPGANGAITMDDVDLQASDADFVIYQLEIPLSVVLESLPQAKGLGKQIILNPAPAVPLPDEIYQGLGHLILNESEAAILSRVDEDQLSKNFEDVAGFFHSRGVRVLVLTLGSKGVYWSRKDLAAKVEESDLVPAHKVHVVDTTAAGDTFIGAYAAWLSRHSDHDIAGAVAFANRAASLAVQKSGAQSAIPFLGEID